MTLTTIDNLRTLHECRPLMREAWQLMERLYPICRSITGEGVRQSLAIVASTFPLRSTRSPSGTQVFDWEVPLEWNVREAWIKGPDGRRVVDLRDHTLHLMSYSTPVRATMTTGGITAASALASGPPRLDSLSNQLLPGGLGILPPASRCSRRYRMGTTRCASTALSPPGISRTASA